MKLFYPILAATIVFSNAGIAQKTTVKPAGLLVKDSFAINVLSTVDKVVRIAGDPSITAMVLAGEPLRTYYQGQPVYQANLQIPGAHATEFMLTSVDRLAGFNNWEWKCVMLQYPNNQRRADIQAVSKKLDSLLIAFNSSKRTPQKTAVSWKLDKYEWMGNDAKYDDQVVITVVMQKKITSTEQQAGDSLVTLYRPLLRDSKTSGECARIFGNALKLENISSEKIAELYTSLFKEVANVNINAAFDMWVSPPYPVKEDELFATLTSSQQADFRTHAKKIVSDYAAMQYDAYNKKDVVIEKKKEIEQAKVPTDPCEKEKWGLSFKPGNDISQNGRIGRIMHYNCNTHTYSIAWLNAGAKKLELENNVTAGSLAGASGTRAPFMICGNCKGVGHSLEYDWYQVNVASNYYARGNEQHKVSCGVCWGSGFIKVR